MYLQGLRRFELASGTPVLSVAKPDAPRRKAYGVPSPGQLALLAVVLTLVSTLILGPAS